MDTRARPNPGAPWVVLLSFALAAGFCRPVGAQANSLTAAELRKNLAEAPEPEEVIAGARLASRGARVEFIKQAAGGISAATLRSAVARLQALKETPADRWTLEILHHLPEGHDFRMQGPLELGLIWRSGVPARLIDWLYTSSDRDERSLLTTLLSTLPQVPKSAELSGRIWKVVLRRSDWTTLRVVAVKALRGDPQKDSQKKVLRQYLAENSSPVRAALLDLVDPAPDPRTFDAVKKRYDSVDWRGTDEVQAFLRLAARAKRDEGLAALRDGAIYARAVSERTLAVELLAAYAGHSRFLEAVKEVSSLQVNEPELRRQMKTALLELLAASSDPNSLDLIAEAMEDQDPGVRLAAVYVLRRFQGDKTVPLFTRLLKDRVPQVVSGAIWGLFFTRRGEALDAIIENLEVLAKSGRSLLDEALRSLKLAMGVDQKDPAGWVEWRRSNGPPRDGFETSSKSGRGRTVVRGFFQHRIYSQRPLFVLDVSNSMDARDGFFSRLEVLYNELAGALGSLDETAAFSIIAFDSTVHSWPSGPQSPTPENVQSALRFLNQLTRAGGTNFHAALGAALKTTEFDTVYFLSDGNPTVGELKKPAELLEWFRATNAERGLILNTVGIGEHNDLLHQLAVQNGGVYKLMPPRGGAGE